MKLYGLAAVTAGAAALGLQALPSAPETVLFLSGNELGYLSPCGCSAPMVSGVRRRASVIRQMGIPGRTLLLENGGWVKSAGRQDELKVEAFAQLHSYSSGAAINLTSSEAALGPGSVLSIGQLSGNHIISSSVKMREGLELPAFRKSDPFLIGGVSTRAQAIADNLGGEVVPPEVAIPDLLQRARAERLYLIILLEGSREDAVDLAKRFPQIALIQYQSIGNPPERSQRVGNVLLASVGDGGKAVVRLVWKGDRFKSYVPIVLEPGYGEDPTAARAYNTYLSRVSEEKLLEALPRIETSKFAGTAACFTCHADAAKVWKSSKHAKALATLEHEKHDRDPDCVECHVVGLASIYGFRSRRETPQLADVGCESCHGPGAAHVAQPKVERMPKIGPESCVSCHRVENSPKFDFATYWARIRHK
jgi:hypothetical protein